MIVLNKKCCDHPDCLGFQQWQKDQQTREFFKKLFSRKGPIPPVGTPCGVCLLNKEGDNCYGERIQLIWVEYDSKGVKRWECQKCYYFWE